jgi:riboflavin kinase/FMN adenylyltransferase
LDNGNDVTMEVNILDFDGDIYGQEISVSFVRYIREDIRFLSLDGLKRQLMKDEQTVRTLMQS